MSKPNEWQRIDDVLTEEGIKKLHVGEILTFDYEGSRNEYRITEIKDGEVWVKPVHTMSIQEADEKLSDEGLELHTTKSHEVKLDD